MNSLSLFHQIKALVASLWWWFSWEDNERGFLFVLIFGNSHLLVQWLKGLLQNWCSRHKNEILAKRPSYQQLNCVLNLCMKLYPTISFAYNCHRLYTSIHAREQTTTPKMTNAYYLPGGLAWYRQNFCSVLEIVFVVMNVDNNEKIEWKGTFMQEMVTMASLWTTALL